MDKQLYRILIVCSHPVQYAVPWFRQLAQHPRIDATVAYCSMKGVKASLDSGFGVQVKWDIPLLEGYKWIEVSNLSLSSRFSRFFENINLGLWKLIRQGNFDAVYICGHYYSSAWIAILAAKFYGVPIFFTTDAHSLATRSCKTRWKQKIKSLLLPKIFDIADIIFAGSSGTSRFLESLGLATDKIILGRNVVDNNWWRTQAAQVDSTAVRSKWNIPVNAPIVLFCAKLQPWKRPQEILQAFAKVHISDAYLVFAGDGPLKESLETDAKALGILKQVRFLGFINQSQLPSVYRSSDLFVLPSEDEPFGVVVNEAMVCGCPAIVSDRVGASFDLIENGKTGFVYPSGDLDALAQILRQVLGDRQVLKQMGTAASSRMNTWSPSEKVESILQGLKKATVVKV